jgi:choline dehydrogenase-like flavoprotein
MRRGWIRQRAETASADAVVIGSGPGGAVAASLLAEAGRSVLLVEEGRHLPLASAPHFSREEILQKYRNAGINVAFGKSKLAYAEGRCVGGGSEINRGLYHRISESVLSTWRSEYGVSNLTMTDLEPHFDACEKTAAVRFLPGPAPRLSQRLADGAELLGWSCMEVPRLFIYRGEASAGESGRKQSMTETFVPRFLAAGGRLQPDTRAVRLERTARGWTVHAIERPEGGAARSLEIHAASVVVAAGAVQSPALLRRSGIRSNVGDSLRFHPMLKVIAQFPDEVNIADDLEPVHQIKEFDPRFSMGCSMSKRPALAMAMAPHADMLERVDTEWARMAIYYVQSTGGRANVRNLPGFDDPVVRVQLGSGDLQELADGLVELARVLFAAGAEKIYPSIPGYPVLSSMDDVAKLPATLAPERANPTALHLFSSCPMGENRSRCATDSFGQVHDARGLFVFDCSILPAPTVVNPQGTVMAVAHRNATRAIENRLL